MKMKRYITAIWAIALSACVSVSCVREHVDSPITPAIKGDGNIDILCTLTSVADTKSSTISTRSLINQLAVQSLETNFIRLDEEVDTGNTGHNNGKYTFGSWENALVMDGRVAASADNTIYHYRSVLLDPLQTYKTFSTGSTDNNNLETTYYNTRMVGWYPHTCTLTVVDGEKVAAPLNSFSSVMSRDVVDGETVTGITFTGLDGTMDIMVSNLKEGQRKHNTDDVQSYSSQANNPFGKYGTQASEHNYFEFKHYMAAVRIYAAAEQSETSLATWGTIKGVNIADQPTTVKISLPTEKDTFGKLYAWSDEKTLPIQTDAMFYDVLNYDTSNETVTFPISMKSKSSINDPVYLGYSLVLPDNTVTIELETAAGIMTVSVPPVYKNPTTGATEEIFKSGCIYNIRMSLTTSGKIEIFISNDDDETFENLTPWDTANSRFKNANCFIVDPTNPNNVDGYVFDGTVVGNGDEGIILNTTFDRTTSDIHPVAAKLIWESSHGLITGVEFVEQYVRFRTPTTDKGNAVIGVYSNHECTDLLWSWHIWVTDTPQDILFEDVPSGVSTTDIVLLDRNLGATYAPSSSESWTDANRLATYGLYYQWGRKDPTPGPSKYNYSSRDMETATYYDYSGTEQNTVTLSILSSPTIENSIKAPLAFIVPNTLSDTYYYNWLHNMTDELWGYNSETQAVLTKTIYDPCPYGYRVAGDELQTLFKAASDNSGISTTNNGNAGMWVSYSGSRSFFPWAGYKGVDRNFNDLTGAWRYVGEKGDYMDARITNDVTTTVGTTTVTYYKHRGRQYLSSTAGWEELYGDFTYSSTLTQDYTNRRTGASVRCVRESVSDMATLDISLALSPSTATVPPNTAMKITATANERRVGLNNTQLDNIAIYLSTDGSDFTLLKKQDFSSSAVYTGTAQYTLTPTQYGTYRIKAVVTNYSGTSAEAIQTFKVVDFTPEIEITITPSSESNNTDGHTVAVTTTTNVSDLTVTSNQAWATLDNASAPTTLTIAPYFSGTLLTATITGTGTSANSLSGTWASAINDTRTATLTATSASYPEATKTATYSQTVTYDKASMTASNTWTKTNNYYYFSNSSYYMTINVPAGLKAGDVITITGGAYKNNNRSYTVGWYIANSSGNNLGQSNTISASTRNGVSAGTFTITVPDALDGATSFRLKPYSSSNNYTGKPVISSLTITRN